MQAGRYQLARQTGGRGFYAVVSVEVRDSTDGPVAEVSPNAFAWLKDVYGPDAWEWPVCDDYRTSALRGVRFALANTVQPVDAGTVAVVVTDIHARPADSCPDSVAFAACHATWQALAVTGRNEPRIVGRKIVFDD